MFAILAYEHCHFGWIVRTVWIYQTESQKFEFEFLDQQSALKHTLAKPYSDMIELSDKNADSSIYQKFNRQKYKNLRDFLSKISKDDLDKFIRPQIEKVNAELIKIAITYHIPAFQKVHNHLTVHNRLSLLSKSIQVLFNFNLTEKGLIYSATLINQNSPIELLNHSMTILCRIPAIFILNNNLYLVENVKASMLEAFTRNKSILVSPALVPTYFETFVSNFLLYFDAQSEGFSITDHDIPPKPQLIIHEGISSDFEVTLKFVYGELTVTAQSPPSRFVVKQLPDYHFIRYKRNFDYEQKIINLLLDNGLKLVSSNVFSTHKRFINVISWINHHKKLLKEYGIEIQNEIKDKLFLGEVSISMHHQEKFDWFEIHAELIFGEYKIPVLKLRKQILNNVREIILPNGEKALLPEELLERLKTLLEVSSVENGKLCLNRFNSRYLDGLTSKQPNVPLPDLSPKATLTIPELPVNLREYQKIGFYWLTQLHKIQAGGILADDMGLGKTIQVITLLKSIYSPASNQLKGTIKQLSLFDSAEILASPVQPSLVVVPTSLTDNWLSEFKKVAKELRVIPYVGTRRKLALNSLNKANVILTTYGIVRNDIEILSKIQFETIILDESQIIKNPDSVIFSAIKLLNGKTKITLTGTPIENSLSDLWAQMDYVNPGYLGPLSYFKNRFVTEIEKKHNQERAAELKLLIQPFVLRRTKAEVAKELPDKIEQIVYCTMSEEQEKLYKKQISAIRNEIFSFLEKNSHQSQTHILALKELIHLRLLANHPQIAGYSEIENSGKQLVVQNHLEELYQEGHKVLIFSSFVRHLNLYTNFCQKMSFPYLMLTGQTASKERMQLVEKFQNSSDYRFFFISLKAGGFGLNLQSADYVLLLDPWWNPQAENQAVDRTHRIGQTHNVFIQRYITKNSVEEKMQLIQERKRLLSNDFINQNVPKTLSMEEIKEILQME